MASAALNSSLYHDHPNLHVAHEGQPAYLRLSGTSMSAAITTGVVALMLAAATDGGSAHDGHDAGARGDGSSSAPARG